MSDSYAKVLGNVLLVFMAGALAAYGCIIGWEYRQKVVYEGQEKVWRQQVVVWRSQSEARVRNWDSQKKAVIQSNLFWQAIVSGRNEAFAGTTDPNFDRSLTLKLMTDLHKIFFGREGADPTLVRKFLCRGANAYRGADTAILSRVFSGNSLNAEFVTGIDTIEKAGSVEPMQAQPLERPGAIPRPGKDFERPAPYRISLLAVSICWVIASVVAYLIVLLPVRYRRYEYEKEYFKECGWTLRKGKERGARVFIAVLLAPTFIVYLLAIRFWMLVASAGHWTREIVLFVLGSEGSEIHEAIVKWRSERKARKKREAADAAQLAKDNQLAVTYNGYPALKDNLVRLNNIEVTTLGVEERKLLTTLIVEIEKGIHDYQSLPEDKQLIHELNARSEFVTEVSAGRMALSLAKSELEKAKNVKEEIL